MKILELEPFKGENVQVIVETPKGSVYKYDYDFDLEVFALDKVMPLGMHFPFDFGFVPGTKGDDGDPLDVLVLMDAPIIQGTLIQCRPVCVLAAMQKERNGQEFRNDRIVAISDLSFQFNHIRNLRDINPGILKEIERFFEQYNFLAGKEFKSLGWRDSNVALKLVNSLTLRKNKASWFRGLFNR